MSEDIPTSSFYWLLSELSKDYSDWHSLHMEAQFVAHVTWQANQLCFCFLKTRKRIDIYIKR